MSPKKSILILGSYPPPYGGVPRHLEELAPAMVAAGWTVHILASGHSGVCHHEGFTVYKEPRPAKIRRAIAGLIRGDWSRLTPLLIETGLAHRLQWLTWASLGRNLIRKHGVGVIAVYNLLRLPVGVLLSEEFGLPLVLSNFGESYSHREPLARRREAVRRGVDRAVRRMTLSHHCAASYKELGLHPQVDVIEYGVNLEAFSPAVDGSSTRKSLGIEPDDVLVLYVGRMIRDMGLPTLLAAVPGLVDKTARVKLLVAGGRGNLHAEVERVAATVPGRVHCLPDVPAARLPGLYGAADIVVAPTQGPRACGSLTAIEAMASGRPVIAARVGGIPEIVEEGVTGLLIEPGNAQQLASAIRSLAEDGERRRKMGVLGRARAVARFDVRLQNAAMVRVYDQVLQGAETR